MKHCSQIGVSVAVFTACQVNRLIKRLSARHPPPPPPILLLLLAVSNQEASTDLLATAGLLFLLTTSAERTRRSILCDDRTTNPSGSKSLREVERSQSISF